MKFATILAAGAAAVSAAAVPRDSEASGQWPITNFSFSGVRMSAYEYYRLTVANGSKTTTTCSTTTSYGPGVKIGPFPSTLCEDKSWAFSFTYVNRTNPSPGYILEVTHGKDVGCRWFSQSDIKTTQDPNPNYNYEYLDAPQSYSLSWQDKPCVFA